MFRVGFHSLTCRASMLKKFIDLKHTEQFSRLRTAFPFPNNQQLFQLHQGGKTDWTDAGDG